MVGRCQQTAAHHNLFQSLKRVALPGGRGEMRKHRRTEFIMWKAVGKQLGT